jgi:hypothetical protein
MVGKLSASKYPALAVEEPCSPRLSVGFFYVHNLAQFIIWEYKAQYPK